MAVYAYQIRHEIYNFMHSLFVNYILNKNVRINFPKILFNACKTYFYKVKIRRN